MLKTVKKIFEDEKFSKAYKRVNSTHPIDIYLGYNNYGEKSLVIIEKSIYQIVKSTKIIEVKLEKREDGKIKLEFALIDKFFDEMFYKFCEDIVMSSKNVKKEYSIKHIVDRWNAWKAMFQNASINRLPDQVIQGLIGELYFIKNKMIPLYGYKKAINSWEGPLGGHKDFVINDTWFEVKTCSFSIDVVKINSLEQLDSAKNGYLEIVRLEKINSESSDAVNLNTMVENIKEDILDVEFLRVYYEKLSNLKYNYNPEYNAISFKIGAVESFVVDESFPRIRRNNVPKQVQAVQYNLRISNLKQEVQ